VTAFVSLIMNAFSDGTSFQSFLSLFFLHFSYGTCIASSCVSGVKNTLSLKPATARCTLAHSCSAFSKREQAMVEAHVLLCLEIDSRGERFKCINLITVG
jgi:hypothetical protein